LTNFEFMNECWCWESLISIWYKRKIYLFLYVEWSFVRERLLDYYTICYKL